MNGANVLVIGHVEDPPTSIIVNAASELALTCDVVRPVLGEKLPPLDAFAAVIVLGGPQSAYERADAAFLDDEVAYLAAAHRSGTPILGICLGFQLLAEALGGRALAGRSGLEYGLIDVHAVDPDGRDYDGRWFSFHSDTVAPPPGATVLAESARYPQAWQLGSATAVQFHPELDRPGIESVLANEQGKLAAFGVDMAAVRRELDTAGDLPSRGQRLLATWLRTLTEPAPQPTGATAH